MTEGSPDAEVMRQLLAFVERTSDLVGVVDEQSRVVYLNEAARKRLGVGDTTELTTVDLFPPEAFARYYAEIRPALLRTGSWHGELALLTAAGDTVPTAMTVVGDVGAGAEVHGLVTHCREIEPLAPDDRGGAPTVHDALTGLPGRVIVEDRIAVALAHAARDDRRIAVIVVDVDAMHDINDSFGPAVGDDVLRALARALSRGVRAGDTVARVGGDAFVVLVDGLDEHDTAWQFAERLRDAVRAVSVDTGEIEVGVTASFGVAVGAADDDAGELLTRAEAAMQRAGAMGGATIVGSDDANEESTLAAELAVAVSHGLIRPHVQPVVDLHTGVLVGYQGLARWEHARRGLLEAEQFVDVVTNTPVLPVIDLAVLRRTAAAAARTARNGLPMRAYGHVSRRLLMDVDVERYLTEIAGDVGIVVSDLCVEVAHALIQRPTRRIESALRNLREHGVRTVLSAVDGECEVNAIVEYGFDELRLARRLVRDAVRDLTRRRVASGTIALARAVGLTVIAVGIETEAERIAMRDAGCDFGQGYLFGPVQPAGEID